MSLPHFIERFVGSVVASLLAIVAVVVAGCGVTLSHDGVIAARHVLDWITGIAITVLVRTRQVSTANLAHGDMLPTHK